MAKNLPREVTLISRKDFGFGNVVRLVRDGTKYWYGHPIHREDDGRERMWNDAHHYDKADYVLIEGKDFDLVERVHQARQAHENARRKHKYDRERAKWRLLEKWDEKHPYPRQPKLEEVVPGLLRQEIEGQSLVPVKVPEGR